MNTVLGIVVRNPFSTALLATAAMILACQGQVYVSVVAPEGWSGAEVQVDGRTIRYLRAVEVEDPSRPLSGAVASFPVPLGKHTLTIRKDGFRPVSRMLEYEQSGENYISITETPEPLDPS